MRKFLLFILVIAASALTWYLFIKKYDYQFQTTARYGPGAVFYELSGWEHFSNPGSSEKIRLVDKEPFESLTQRLKVDSSEFIEFKWELEKVNDTITALTLNLVSKKDQLANRWDIVNPFQNSPFLDSIKQHVLAFKKELNEHQSAYRITPENELEDSPEMECICSISKGIPLTQKAGEMMGTISRLENYFLANDLKLKGFPFLKITKWDREMDVIDFDFCFPVADITGLKETGDLELKRYPSQRSLKLIFNGNYRLSHIAWFDALYLADQYGYKTEGLPMEIFYDNPKIDNNSREWRAEIFLPVEK
ncbi:GyrI-like domain-containing protein [Salegentibacter chungangensis]|uniref:GyrI-like domain-containing protein n=1 Tax=Salegentibacter chungangensis TaxID=1335724 RepID=A0ABW3NPF4_9FLAO